jgi:hypothetical protein
MSKPIIRFNLKKVEKNLIKHLKKKMLEVVVRLDAYARNSMTVSNQQGKNPSAPGSTPNIGTGTLKKSITHAVRIDKNEVVGIFGVAKGPASAYARRLELGFVGTVNVREHTRKGSPVRAHTATFNVQPRPFIKPAYQKNKRQIKKILTR